jgi:hypothetical protein
MRWADRASIMRMRANPFAGPIGKPRCFCPIVPFDIEGIRKFGKSDRGFLAIGLAISARGF